MNKDPTQPVQKFQLSVKCDSSLADFPFYLLHLIIMSSKCNYISSKLSLFIAELVMIAWSVSIAMNVLVLLPRFCHWNFSWLFYLSHSYINFVVQSLHDTHLKMVQIIVYTMSFCKFYKAEPRNESTYISFLWQNHLWFILILVSIFVVERNKPMFCLIVLFSTFLLDMREKLISRESWITFPHLPHSGLRKSNYLTLTFENFFPTS